MSAKTSKDDIHHNALKNVQVLVKCYSIKWLFVLLLTEAFEQLESLTCGKVQDAQTLYKLFKTCWFLSKAIDKGNFHKTVLKHHVSCKVFAVVLLRSAFQVPAILHIISLASAKCAGNFKAPFTVYAVLPQQT